MVLVKVGQFVTQQEKKEKGRREEGQNTILRLDVKYVISNHFKF